MLWKGLAFVLFAMLMSIMVIPSATDAQAQPTPIPDSDGDGLPDKLWNLSKAVHSTPMSPEMIG